jgi:membrane associated rhomboid family serine protease
MGLIAIHLLFSFLNQGISWQAHVGGLVVGGLVAAVYAGTRKESQKTMQISALVGIVVLLIGLTIYQANVYGLL